MNAAGKQGRYSWKTPAVRKEGAFLFASSWPWPTQSNHLKVRRASCCGLLHSSRSCKLRLGAFLLFWPRTNGNILSFNYNQINHWRKNICLISFNQPTFYLAIESGNGNPFDFVLQQLSTAINTGPSYLLLGNSLSWDFVFFFNFYKRSVEDFGAQREPLTSLQRICVVGRVVIHTGQ